jgi:hypothetical protein
MHTLARKELVMQSRRYLLVLWFIVALPSLGLAESDIEGWGNTRWGMPHAEVAKIYELNNWEAGNTPINKLKKRVKILGHDFGVAFYFDERSAKGNLYKVVLAHFNATSTDAAWLFSIKEMLIEKYGNPTLFTVKDNMKISRWTKSSGKLKLTTLTGKKTMCAIEYISVSAESEKL